jgi:hypothetical protein
MSIDSEAKNLEAISKAIDAHAARCPFPPTAVVLNPYEVERLGWEEVRGIPIVGDPAIPTGRVRILCGGEGSGEQVEEEVTEAVGVPVEVPVETPAEAEPAKTS